MTATAILFFGLAGVGKSSIAREVQMRLTLPTVFMPLDVFDVPPDAVCAQVLRDERVSERAFSNRLLAAYFGSLRPWLEGGFNVIGEAQPPTNEDCSLLYEKLGGLPLISVHVVSTPSIRPKEPGRRSQAIGEWQAPQFPPDVTLQSTANLPEHLAATLLNRIEPERVQLPPIFEGGHRD